MFLSITCNGNNAQDISWILHKHPDKVQSFDIFSGKAHVFYPEFSENKSKIVLFLDVDTINLVRKLKVPFLSYALQSYVNDRPFVASSFMSSAISNVYSSALNGSCKLKPELVDKKYDLEIEISVIKSIGGEDFIKKVFEPLGYEVELEGYPLDKDFTNWGKSRYYTVKLRNNITFKDLLSHIYVLLPVFDREKHYYISISDVDNLIRKGESWLPFHPLKEEIVNRYFKNMKKYTQIALDKFSLDEDLNEEIEVEENNEIKERRISLQKQRINFAIDKILELKASSVLDLGCGEGQLINALKKSTNIKSISGVDVVYNNLLIAKEKLKLDEMPTHLQEKIKLFQGSAIYKDKRFNNFDVICVLEVIEHMELEHLPFFERVVFEFAKPNYVILSTPNSEYNNKYMPDNPNQLRHDDHRFEWNREEFRNWCEEIFNKFNYTFELFGIGDVDEVYGTPTQASIFKRG